jgi:opacity protein-like surface antigen
MKRALFALALAAALPLSAQAADGIKYSYVEGGYRSADFLDETFDGFGIAGSVAFNDHWYGSANYDRVSWNSIDLDQSGVNVGWHTAVSSKADFLAELGYARFGVDANGLGSDHADGYRVGAGFRGMLAPKFEANAKATYTDGGDFTGDFGIGVGAVYHVSDTWGVTANYTHDQLDGEGFNNWGVGVRASF